MSETVKKSKDGENENPHVKHRERMRCKFLISGFESMPEHEILEFLLFYSIPRKNTNPIAHSLLDRFGTLENVFKADVDELLAIGNVGEKTAAFLRAIGELVPMLKKKALRRGVSLSSISHISEYLTDFFINEYSEKLYMFFLDKGERLIKYKLICNGGVDSITLDTAVIVREAVLSQCKKVILAHNHPGGHREASDADISATRMISRALALVHVDIKDHIIISDGHYYSMAENDLIF